MILTYLAKPTTLLKLAVLCGAAFCAVSSAEAQETKIGYINSQRIVNEALPYKAASAKIKQDFGKRVQDLQDMDARLKAMQAKLEKDAPIMSEADRNKGQRDLIELNKDFQRKQRELQEDLNQRQNEEREVVFDRVNKVITQIADSEKYDLVIQDALYHSARVDITDKVLKALNKQ
jgi:outer membrane protein